MYAEEDDDSRDSFRVSLDKCSSGRLTLFLRQLDQFLLHAIYDVLLSDLLLLQITQQRVISLDFPLYVLKTLVDISASFGEILLVGIGKEPLISVSVLLKI